MLRVVFLLGRTWPLECNTPSEPWHLMISA
jgi:hypothetical protein